MEKGLGRIVSAPSESHNPEKCVEELMSDNDVHCIWMLVSIDWTEACAETLLQMIVTEWTKIRGFSYGSAYIVCRKTEESDNTKDQKITYINSCSLCSLQNLQRRRKQIKTMTWMTVTNNYRY